MVHVVGVIEEYLSHVMWMGPSNMRQRRTEGGRSTRGFKGTKTVDVKS